MLCSVFLNHYTTPIYRWKSVNFEMSESLNDLNLEMHAGIQCYYFVSYLSMARIVRLAGMWLHPFFSSIKKMNLESTLGNDPENLESEGIWNRIQSRLGLDPLQGRFSPAIRKFLHQLECKVHIETTGNYWFASNPVLHFVAILILKAVCI